MRFEMGNQPTHLPQAESGSGPAFLVIMAILSLSLIAKCEPPPERCIFSSDNGKFLLYLEPKALKSFPEVAEDIEADDDERRALGLNQDCRGSLFVVNEKQEASRQAKSFDPVWQQQLFANPVFPRKAFVSSDGKYVVTIDEYGSRGVGPNVVVIYDGEGKMVRRFSLADFMPNQEIQNAMKCDGSVPWDIAHWFDESNQFFVLKIMRRGSSESSDFRIVALRLKDGEVVDPPR